MSDRYCKECKMRIQEEYLYKGELCPMCGVKLDTPTVFTARPKSRSTPQEYVIRIEFTNGKKGDMTINEEQFKTLTTKKANNVVSWYVLRQYNVNN